MLSQLQLTEKNCYMNIEKFEFIKKLKINSLFILSELIKLK